MAPPAYQMMYYGGAPQYVSPGDMAQALRLVGFPEQDIPTMVAVGIAESNSGGGQGILNRYNNYGAWHHGLWQISGLHTGQTGQPNPQLYDLLTNARYAKMLYDRSGFQPWEAYTKGTWRQNMVSIGSPSSQAQQQRQTPAPAPKAPAAPPTAPTWPNPGHQGRVLGVADQFKPPFGTHDDWMFNQERGHWYHKDDLGKGLTDITYYHIGDNSTWQPSRQDTQVKSMVSGGGGSGAGLPPPGTPFLDAVTNRPGPRINAGLPTGYQQPMAPPQPPMNPYQNVNFGAGFQVGTPQQRHQAVNMVSQNPLGTFNVNGTGRMLVADEFGRPMLRSPIVAPGASGGPVPRSSPMMQSAPRQGFQTTAPAPSGPWQYNAARNSYVTTLNPLGMYAQNPGFNPFTRMMTQGRGRRF